MIIFVRYGDDGVEASVATNSTATTSQTKHGGPQLSRAGGILKNALDSANQYQSSINTISDNVFGVKPLTPPGVPFSQEVTCDIFVHHLRAKLWDDVKNHYSSVDQHLLADANALRFEIRDLERELKRLQRQASRREGLSTAIHSIPSFKDALGDTDSKQTETTDSGQEQQEKNPSSVILNRLQEKNDLLEIFEQMIAEYRTRLSFLQSLSTNTTSTNIVQTSPINNLLKSENDSTAIKSIEKDTNTSPSLGLRDSAGNVIILTDTSNTSRILSELTEPYKTYELVRTFPMAEQPVPPIETSKSSGRKKDKTENQTTSQMCIESLVIRPPTLQQAQEAFEQLKANENEQAQLLNTSRSKKPASSSRKSKK